MSRLDRIRKCGRVATGDVVGVHRVGSGEAVRGAVSGLQTCGSVWACPVCSAHIRQEYCEDLRLGAERHQAAGGGLAMLTLTFAHDRGDDLAATLDGLLEAWRSVIRGSPWERARARYGIVGYVRSVEVTWGAENGWHPHLHVLLATGEPLTGEQRVELEAWVYRRWVEMVGRRGLGEPSREHGVRLDLAGAGAGLYVAKVQERSLSLEMTRGDLKRGRGGRWLPFELLWAAGNGEALALHLWWEYEAATRGRRSLTWSRGLRERWGLGVERDDEEIVQDHETSAENLLVTLDREQWAAVCAAGLDYEVIAAAESGGSAWDATCAVWRVVGQAVEVAMRRRAARRRGG